jgi:hypothetical protein
MGIQNLSIQEAKKEITSEFKEIRSELKEIRREITKNKSERFKFFCKYVL